MTTDSIIGKNIKLYREKNGFIQETVAGFLSVKREMISYYENGTREIPLEVLSRLSDLYGAEMLDFYEENTDLVKENIVSSFRTNGFGNDDLEIIASFKAVVKNYLKMNNLLAKI